jgi:hypothetical protein
MANKTEIKHTAFNATINVWINEIEHVLGTGKCVSPDHGGYNIHTYVYYINIARVEN